MRSLPLFVLVVSLSASSCSEKTERPPASAPSPTVVVVGGAAAPAASAERIVDASGFDGEPQSVAFLRDGTLAVATDKEVLTIDVAGTVRRKPTAGRTPKLDGTENGEGMILEGASDIVLLETPSLREIHAGPGAALVQPGGAIMTRSTPPSVVMQIAGREARFTLPPGKPKRVDRVDVVAGGKLAVVTWADDDTTDADATIFEVATGARVGRALPMGLFSMGPIAAVGGDRQYGVKDGSVSIIDLKTGAVARTAKVACPKDSFLGNPMPSPAGDLLLVTCGDDGIALDARTLVQKRRYIKLMPGCDNIGLPARYEAKNTSELVLEGCGGEARLDLRTGKYRCSDSIGLVGAPYETLYVPGAQPQPRRVPPGRENLPRCRSGDDSSAGVPLGSSGTYVLVYGAPPSIVHAGGKIPLHEGVGVVALSADETKMGYTMDRRVIVRSLPGGAVLRELTRR